MKYTAQDIDNISRSRNLAKSYVEGLLSQKIMTVMQFQTITGLTRNTVYSRTEKHNQAVRSRHPLLTASYPYPDRKTRGPMFIVHDENAKQTIIDCTKA